MNKTGSLFVSGMLVGALLATVGFSLYLRGQKAMGGSQSRLVLKLGHCLDMVSVWKHVNRLHLNRAVYLLHHSEIPGHCGRIAGHINNPLDTQLENLFDDILMHTGPGRIDTQQVRPVPYP